MSTQQVRTAEELATYWSSLPARECNLEAFRDFIAVIQKQSFEFGRSFGMRESADLFNQCKETKKDFMVELLSKASQ